MQHERGEPDALGHQPGDHLGRERAARARHLGAARFGGVDVLVRAQRPRSLDVAVADGPAVDGQPGQRPAAAAASRATQRRPASPYGVVQRERRARPERERRRRRRTGPALAWCGRPAARSSTTQRSAVELGREVDDERGAVGGDGVERGRDRARRVHDDEVARLEERRQQRERAVHEVPAARWATIMRTASRVRPRASGGSRGFELGRQVEGQPRRSGGAARSLDDVGRGHGCASSEVAGPVAAAGRRLGQQRRSAGTTDSGSGRSEMSSPGNASWCICVRMSPGSKR